jgi:hypothetical protein
LSVGLLWQCGADWDVECVSLPPDQEDAQREASELEFRERRERKEERRVEVEELGAG